MDYTLYKANFEITCWHDYCYGCNWIEKKICLLFNQKLKEDGNDDIYNEFPSVLRCKACIELCSNLPQENIEE
jgi:hypothetical protein